MSEKVVQHDPEIADGRAAWKLALTKTPTALRIERSLRVLGEGQLVAVQSRGHAGAQEAVVYDLFRVENDLIAEHWRVFEDVPEKSDNANGMF